jgi:hypothetical protein
MNLTCRRSKNALYRLQNHIMPACSWKSCSHLGCAILPHSSLYRVQNCIKETWHNTSSRKSDILFISLHRPKVYQNGSNKPVPQSIQSARLSVQLSAFGTPTPSPASECCPPPLFGFKTRTCGRGGEGIQFRRRDRHSGTLCILYGVYSPPNGLTTPEFGNIWWHEKIKISFFEYFEHPWLKSKEANKSRLHLKKWKGQEEGK